MTTTDSDAAEHPADEKVMDNMTATPSPISRKLRSRKKEKFKRHLALLGKDSGGGSGSGNSTSPEDSRDPTSPKSPPKATKPKPKPSSHAVKARAPPAGFKSLQNPSPSTLSSPPSEDSSSNGRFPKRPHIKHVATSPSEDSVDHSDALPKRAVMTNPSEEESVDELMVSNVVRKSTISTPTTNVNNSDDNVSEASAPTDVQANTSGKSSTLKRLLQRSHSNKSMEGARSDVDIPFDEVKTSKSNDVKPSSLMKKSASLPRLSKPSPSMQKKTTAESSTIPRAKPSQRVISTSGRSRSLTRSRSLQKASSTDNKPPSRSNSRKSKLVEMIASRKAALLKEEAAAKQKILSTASTASSQKTPEIFPDPTIEDIQYEDSEDKAEETVPALSETNLAEHDNNNNDDTNMEQYDDPPLQEMESEVSVGGGGGFDMGSIHDYLPSDIRQRCNPAAETANDDQAETVWASSNVVFENSGDEKTEETTQDAFAVAESAVNDTVAEEKKEAMETTDDSNDASWDATTLPFATTNNAGRPSQPTGDGMDMFDTSSWAAGTDTRFSDVSLSRLAANVDSEKQFVNLMMEEMKTRALTDDESRVLSEARQNIEQAEETAKMEANRVQKDDVPLIGANSTGEDDLVVDNTSSLEERLKTYEESGEVDEQSVSESIDDESESDDDEDAEVDYVDQQDMADDEEEYADNGIPDNMEQDEMVPAENAPALDVDSLKNGTQQSGYESLQPAIASMPPPPPPGQPKKKKRSKTKSGSKKGFPLIAPPPEEKIKQWEENKARAQNYVASMNEKLEKEDSRALDAAFLQLPREKDAEADSNVSASSDGIPKTVLSHVAAGNMSSSLHDDQQDDVHEINMFLSGLSDDDLQTNDDTSEKNEEAQAEEAQGDHLEAPSVSKSLDVDVDNEEKVQPSMFSSPGKPPGETKLSKVFHDKSGDSKKGDTILVDARIADKVALASSAASRSFDQTYSPEKLRSPSSAHRDATLQLSEPAEILCWFSKSVLDQDIAPETVDDVTSTSKSLLQDRENFNSLCQYVADTVNNVTSLLRPEIVLTESVVSSFDESTVVSAENTLGSADEAESLLQSKRTWMKPAVLPENRSSISPMVLAANIVSFFCMASKLSKVQSPFGDSNPFLAMVVESSLTNHREDDHTMTPQELLFAQLDERADLLIDFAFRVKYSCDAEVRSMQTETATDVDVVGSESLEPIKDEDIVRVEVTTPSRRSIVPETHPSPFESSVWEVPRVVAVVLSFLGDPVAVCRMKMVNRFCHRVVAENEHILMQNAVRTGGIEMSVRPAFWMYVALHKCGGKEGDGIQYGSEELRNKAIEGENGKWHNVIDRDVARSFGNMPPHKTGARQRNDSIVKALVTYGQNRIMKRGVKGGGEPFPTPEIGPKSSKKPKSRPTSPTFSSPWEGKGGDDEDDSVASEVSETPTDRVSDWGGVSPKGSFAGSANETDYEEGQLSTSATDMSMSVEELALSGNSLTADAKIDLRNKLSFILHCLAVTHEDIGYCQGMDYVVAHLLRILQETVKWKAANNLLADVISTAASMQGPSSEPVTPENYQAIYKEIDDNLVVEEVVLRIMDTLFLHYNLRHMYWPELRCLKTCCRVFERLIQLKLPVLADHFEHHDLNVGLFALGWFQTLFLYLPSMPSATVCHMWDIWLVERSFKIFFRVGTAILFLSQPTLLNYELEGMMQYLNTIPDATLLRPDILIPCALNIKVTNKMLQELEAEVMKQP